MLSKIKLYIYGAIFAVFVKVSIWLYFKGRKDQQNSNTRRRVDAMKEAKDTRHEIQNSDDSRLVDILSGRLRK